MIVHHPNCNANYPEKPRGEKSQPIITVSEGGGTVVRQCGDCGAVECEVQQELPLNVEQRTHVFDRKASHVGVIDGMRGRLLDARRAKDFALAGNAHFTLRSLTTSTRYTYRVNAPKHSTELEQKKRAQRPIWFVAALTGPDNDVAYQYIGMIRDTLEFHWGDKSRIGKDAPCVQAFYWFWNGAVRPENALRFDQMEVWHEGRCGMCGRRLTVPESVASGYGPECATRVRRGT